MFWLSVAMNVIASMPSGAMGILLQWHLPFNSLYAVNLLFCLEVQSMLRVSWIYGIILLHSWIEQLTLSVARVAMMCDIWLSLLLVPRQ
jgi:hypothetical protein